MVSIECALYSRITRGHGVIELFLFVLLASVAYGWASLLFHDDFLSKTFFVLSSLFLLPSTFTSPSTFVSLYPFLSPFHQRLIRY
jgi:hypothetical protein